MYGAALSHLPDGRKERSPAQAQRQGPSSRSQACHTWPGRSPELNHQLKQAVVMPVACFELAVKGVNARSARGGAHVIYMLLPML